MYKLFPLLALVILPHCASTPEPTVHKEVAAAPVLHNANEDQQSQAAAFVMAGKTANEQNPEGPPKSAVQGSLETALSFLPQPKQGHLDFAMTTAMFALQGDLAKASSGWAKSQSEGEILKGRIAALEKEVESQKARAAQDLADQLSHERKQSDEKQRTIVTYIIFGSSVLCIIGAVVVGNFAGAVPQFGPRAALGLGVAGGVLFGLGMAMRIVERMMDEHPYIFWGSLLGVIISLAVAVALIYSNHTHHAAATTTVPRT